MIKVYISKYKNDSVVKRRDWLSWWKVINVIYSPLINMNTQIQINVKISQPYVWSFGFLKINLRAIVRRFYFYCIQLQCENTLPWFYDFKKIFIYNYIYWLNTSCFILLTFLSYLMLIWKSCLMTPFLRFCQASVRGTSTKELLPREPVPREKEQHIHKRAITRCWFYQFFFNHLNVIFKKVAC